MIITDAYTVLDSDNCESIFCEGNALYTITLNNASNYKSYFYAYIINNDGAGKIISCDGLDSFVLYPNQSIIIKKQDSNWAIIDRNRYKLPNTFTSFYVDTVNGNDLTDGLTAGTAFQTVQACINNIYQNIDCNQQQPTIQVVAGSTITEQVTVFGQPTGAAPQIFITGNTTAGNQIPWVLQGNNQTAVQARDNGICTIQGFAFSAQSYTGCCFINPSQNGVIDYTSINFGPCLSGWHIKVDQNGSANCLETGTTTTITGSFSAHILMSGTGASHTMGGATINIPSTLSFYCFLQIIGLCSVNWASNSFTGAGSGSGSTGTKYLVQYNSFVSLGGTTLPGNNPGTANNGAIVV